MRNRTNICVVETDELIPIRRPTKSVKEMNLSVGAPTPLFSSTISIPDVPGIQKTELFLSIVVRVLIRCKEGQLRSAMQPILMDLDSCGPPVVLVTLKTQAPCRFRATKTVSRVSGKTPTKAKVVFICRPECWFAEMELLPTAFVTFRTHISVLGNSYGSADASVA